MADDSGVMVVDWPPVDWCRKCDQPVAWVFPVAGGGRIPVDAYANGWPVHADSPESAVGRCQEQSRDLELQVSGRYLAVKSWVLVLGPGDPVDPDIEIWKTHLPSCSG